MYKKITPQQTKEMKKLKKEGWTYVEIAEKYKVSKDTVSLHIKGLKGKCHKRDGIGDNPEEIPLFIRENIEAQKPKVYNKDKCQVCGAEKEKKFRLTHFCSLKCYEGLTSNM